MIFKRFITYLIPLLAFIACNKFNGPKKPKNLISKEQMVNIIIDAKLISSASSINKKLMVDSGVDIENYVYNKHQIDSLQFALSNEYYAYYVKDYEEIYNQVTDSLELLQTKYKDLEAEEWKEKTKREEDSLKAVFANNDYTLLKNKINIRAVFNKDSLLKNSEKNKLQKGFLVEPISDNESQ